MTAALIIATGRTARTNNFEPLKEIGSTTAIQHIVMAFQRADIERILIVYDKEEYKLDRVISGTKIEYLLGDETGEMFANIKLGLDYLQDKCSAVLITNVNVPLFSSQTIRALVCANEPICSPRCQNKSGHPLFLSAKHFQSIVSYTGIDGLAGALKASHLNRTFIDVEDEGVLANVQSQGQFEQSLASYQANEITSDIRIRLIKEKPFYGPGTHHLLQLINERNSLLDACRHMGISYSKGRKLISALEQQVGYPVIESRQGGQKGGHSFVTKQGQRLMQHYSDFCAEARCYINQLYNKYFDFND